MSRARAQYTRKISLSTKRDLVSAVRSTTDYPLRIELPLFFIVQEARVLWFTPWDGHTALNVCLSPRSPQNKIISAGNSAQPRIKYLLIWYTSFVGVQKGSSTKTRSNERRNGFGITFARGSADLKALRVVTVAVTVTDDRICCFGTSGNVSISQRLIMSLV